METTKTELNSCLMLAVNLVTPIDLAYIFDKPDLKDTGLELDSHITILYAAGRELPRLNLLPNFKDILGETEYLDFLDVYCKNQVQHKVLDIFDLGSFDNDSSYIVLKMKKEFNLYDKLSLLNKGLRLLYSVSSDFDSYNPHVSLAELKPGLSEKYLGDEKLMAVLEDSYVSFEDILLSYGLPNEPGDRKQYYLTNYKAVDRYFRIHDLEKTNETILKEIE